MVDSRREDRADADQPGSAAERARQGGAGPQDTPGADDLVGEDQGWTVFGPSEAEEPAASPEPSLISQEVEEQAALPAAQSQTEPIGRPEPDPAPQGSIASPTAYLPESAPVLEPPELAEELIASAPPPPAVTSSQAGAGASELRPRTQELQVPPPRSERLRSDSLPAPALGLPRPWVALAVVAPAVLLGAWLVSRLGNKPTQAKESLASAPPSAEQIAQVEHLEREIAALRGELERSRVEASEAASLRGELELTRGEVATRIESLERLLAQAQQVGPARVGEPPQPVRESATAAEPLESPDASAHESVARESASGRPTAASDPAELAELRAKGFDRALAALESGRAGDALGRLEGLIAQRVFSGLENDGSALLWSLCSGWKALGSNGAANGSPVPGPDSQALAQVRSELGRARGLRPSFETAAVGWLATAGAAPERLARLDLALAALDKELGWASVELEARHGPDWERIRALGVPQGPAQVLLHSICFACDHEAELCERTADAYTVSCLWSGDVDLEGLAQAQHLASWGQHVLSLQVDKRSEQQEDLLWLWYAQRWFVQGERAASFEWDGLAAPERVAPSDDWRAELRLAIELAASDFRWPGGLGARALYSVDSGGPAPWRVDETRRLEREGAGWHIDRLHFDAQGRPLGSSAEVRIERSGERFAYAGASGALLDLRASGARVSVEPCGVTLRPELPELEGFELGPLADLARLSDAGRKACLVFQDGEWTRWFAPGLGLVREVRDGPEGKVRIELCALGVEP